MKRLAELVEQLEGAVDAWRPRACLRTGPADRRTAGVGARSSIRHRAARPRTDVVDDRYLGFERGTSEPEPDGAVFPVPFGTNRRPHSRGAFALRTAGVEVYVPEAHWFGGRGVLSGTNWWGAIRATVDYVYNSLSRRSAIRSFQKPKRQVSRMHASRRGVGL